MLVLHILSIIGVAAGVTWMVGCIVYSAKHPPQSASSDLARDMSGTGFYPVLAGFAVLMASAIGVGLT